MTTARQRVGFVIDGRIPSLRAVARGRCGPREWCCGQYPQSAVARMRFGSIAAWVNRHASGHGLHYELYRPWRARTYQALVFLKSMGAESACLARRARAHGARIVFDANVDYFTPPAGEFPCAGLAPTESQRAAAIEMARLSDALIADSSWIAAQARAFNPNVRWIPDNVDLDDVPAAAPPPAPNSKLDLLWSGEAHKAFDLLLIDQVLIEFAGRVRLVLVTGDLAAAQARWTADLRARFARLRSCVETQVLPFQSVPQLFTIYLRGGLAISPRFLDNTYNQGHTEWKITLALACGRPVCCSPQPSYLDVVARVTDGLSVRICPDHAAWRAALRATIEGAFDWPWASQAARDVVARHYATPVVAGQHADFLREVLDRGGLPCP